MGENSWTAFGNKASEENIDPLRVHDLRLRLQEADYMERAIQRIAQELTIEFMENAYGFPFR